MVRYKIDFSKKLSHNVRDLKPSATLQITAKGKEMARRGLDVVSLGAGEPDFPTPQNVKDAAIKAIKENFTYYTPVSGIQELKNAVIKKLKKINNLTYQPNDICISCGAKHSIVNVLQALLNPGDEVLIPSPYWVSYPAQVQLLGGIPRFIPTDKKFRLEVDFIEENISDRSKVIILNYPSNPTGMTYTLKELKKIADTILGYDLVILSDEVYEYFTYDGIIHQSFATISDEVYNRTITINSLSKTYSMTGWRIGYAACPQGLSEVISRIQGQTTSNPTSIAQKAALEALQGPQDQITEMVKSFDDRRMYVLKRLNEIKGIEFVKPKGAFYIFPDISVYGLSPTQFSSKLLNQNYVTTIPGEPFGSSTNIRISYTVSWEDLEKGMDRLESFCSKIL